MKCSCFEDMREKVVEKYSDKKELRVEWKNKVFFLTGGDNLPVVLGMDIEYRETKTNGLPYKNKTKESISAVMAYCPFCGRKLEREEKKS